MKLSIATWNCADGFARKAKFLRDLNADIISIQELRQSAFDAVAPSFKHAFFQPSKTARGMAVFSNLDLPIARLNVRFRKSDQCYLPLILNIPRRPIALLSVWVKPVEDYVRPSHRAFKSFFRATKDIPKIILGDLNQNKIFDVKRRLGLFSDTEKMMRKNSMQSLYHLSKREAFGQESRPTHFLTFSKERPYHLDYIFSSESMKCEEFQLYPEQPWFSGRRSDHLPMRAVLSV